MQRSISATPELGNRADTALWGGYPCSSKFLQFGEQDANTPASAAIDYFEASSATSTQRWCNPERALRAALQALIQPVSLFL